MAYTTTRTQIQLHPIEGSGDWYPTTDAAFVLGLEDWLKANNFIQNSALENYVTTESLGKTLEDYVLTEDLNKELAKKADKSEIADMATKTWVNQQEYLTEDDLEDYALKSELPTDFYSKSEVDTRIANAKSEIIGGAGQAYDTLKEIETWITTHQGLYEGLLQGIGEKATKKELEDAVADMATQTWVKAQNYLTSHQSLDDYYTKSEVYTQEEIDNLFEEFDISDQLDNYYTKSETYTKEQVNAEIEKAIDELKKLIGVKATLA